MLATKVNTNVQEQLKEIMQEIKNKSVSISVKEGYFIIQNACTCPYNDNGIHMFTISHLENCGHRDIISLTIGNVVEIEELEVEGNKEWTLKTLDNSLYVISLI